jgi:hypothetical protein
LGKKYDKGKRKRGKILKKKEKRGKNPEKGELNAK